MKTICGITMRGAAYFGASVHVCMGVMFFTLLLDRIVYQVYFKNASIPDVVRMEKEGVIYFGLFLPLGILIFKAIDKENKTLLKWVTFIFLMLQLFGIIIKIKFGPSTNANLLANPRGPVPGESRTAVETIENFKIVSLEIISTIAYLVTLYLYMRQLECFPGRIYTHGMIPLYSTSSSFFMDHRGPPPGHHHHHHGMHRGSMTTPFTYTFEPPPPYSSTNNLAVEPAPMSTGPASCGTTQQQPCSSRSVFHNIGKIGSIAFKKRSSSSNPNANVPVPPLNNPSTGPPSGGVEAPVNSSTGGGHFPTNDLNRGLVNPRYVNASGASSSYGIAAPETDSPLAPLLQQDGGGKQNDLNAVAGDGIQNSRRNSRSRREDALLNLKQTN